MRTARNVAIVALLAVPVAFVPGGGNAVDAIMTTLLLAFLAGISFAIYTFFRQNHLTVLTLRDSRRAVLYGAAGGLALLIAGQDELTASSGGVLIWIALVIACGVAAFLVWRETSTL